MRLFLAKVRQLGLKMALSDKAMSGNLIVIDSSDMKEAKTKTLATALETHRGSGRNILFWHTGGQPAMFAYADKLV